MPQLYFATTNIGKILEIERICANFSSEFPDVFVNALDVSTVEEPEETGETFAENAEIKFLYYESAFESTLTLPQNQQDDEIFILAEDSGFEIPALEGFPSIHSARFLKQFSTKKEAFLEIKRMLEEKKLYVEGQKTQIAARFVCDICTRIDGTVSHFHGTVEGTILFDDMSTDVIEKGFGYDPIFVPNPIEFTNTSESTSHKTFAQMDGVEKDTTSHRAKAFWQFLNFIS